MCGWSHKRRLQPCIVFPAQVMHLAVGCSESAGADISPRFISTQFSIVFCSR